MRISARARFAHAETRGMLATGPIRARRTLGVGASRCIIETSLTRWNRRGCGGCGRLAIAIHHTMACCAHAMTRCLLTMRVGRTRWTLVIDARVWQTGIACLRCLWACLIASGTSTNITTILACHTSSSCIAARATIVVVALLIPNAVDASVTTSRCWRCSTRSFAHILDMLTDSALQQRRLVCVSRTGGIRAQARTCGQHVLS